jgi:hypothetical protein
MFIELGALTVHRRSLRLCHPWHLCVVQCLSPFGPSHENPCQGINILFRGLKICMDLSV